MNELSNSKIKLDKWYYKFYLKFKEKWILASFLTTIPAIWFPIIINIFGKTFHFVDDDGLTALGSLSTVLVYIIFLLFSGFMNYSGKKEKLILEAQKQEENDTCAYALDLLDKTNEICNKKYDLLINSYEDNNRTLHYDTTEHIKFILEQFSDLIKIITPLQRKHINVTLAYAFCESKSIVWIDGQNTGSGKTKQLLAENSTSAFYHVFNNLDDFIFYNDKNDAIRDRKYLPNTRDYSSNNSGSIICKRIVVSDNYNEYVNAVLSVSTTKKIDCSDNEEICKKIAYNFRSSTIPEFEKRLQIELLNLYATRKIYKSQDKNKIEIKKGT